MSIVYNPKISVFLGKVGTLPFKSNLKKLLTGLSISQEYICLDLAKHEYSLSVYLSALPTPTEVTACHLFLGYKPLIIGIPLSTGSEEYQALKSLDQIQLTFMTNETFQNVLGARPIVLAKLDLTRIAIKTLGDQVIQFYEGRYGQHAFLNFFNQLINRHRDNRRKSDAANINLIGNLYDQVRIAYSVPRIISVITVGEGELFNMFPTDLHGPAGKKFYISSLRIGGRANDQVENLKRVVISQVSASAYKQVYLLGKNHMQDLKPVANFSIDNERSETYKFPLPEGVTQYRELNRIDSFDHGIHRIHLYEVMNSKGLRDESSILAHIHQYYAQWRTDRHLPTQMLLR